MKTLDNITAKLKKWHLLTEIPQCAANSSTRHNRVIKPDNKTKQASIQQSSNPLLTGMSPVLIKLMWDILVYPYSSVSIRIRRLGISARAYEQAKNKGCEKGFIIQSRAGQTTYLIATKKSFEAFNMPYPYKRAVSVEHSYYVGLGVFLLSKDPSNRDVQAEMPLGSSGAASDIVTVGHNSTRSGYEVTLTTTNVLSNATKYEHTDFVAIYFLCRDYKLKEAVRACCREGGLSPDLIARLEYTHVSALLRRQRKLSQY